MPKGSVLGNLIFPMMAMAAGAPMMPACASDMGDRIATAASALAARRIPYVTPLLGGPSGPEQDGLPADGLDCMTFIEAALLRTAGVSTPVEQRKWLRSTRYDDRPPGYCTRAHYLSDWVDRNAAHDWLEDITARLAEADGTPLHRHRWDRGWMATHQLDPDGCIGKPGESRSVAYIAPENYERIAHRLSPGDVLVFVSTDAGLDSAHAGIVEPHGGIAMASSITGHAMIVKDWLAYARAHRSRFLGVRVIRVLALPGR